MQRHLLAVGSPEIVLMYHVDPQGCRRVTSTPRTVLVRSNSDWRLVRQAHGHLHLDARTDEPPVPSGSRIDAIAT